MSIQQDFITASNQADLLVSVLNESASEDQPDCGIVLDEVERTIKFLNELRGKLEEELG